MFLALGHLTVTDELLMLSTSGVSDGARRGIAEESDISYSVSLKCQVYNPGFLVETHSFKRRLNVSINYIKHAHYHSHIKTFAMNKICLMVRLILSITRNHLM